MAGVAGSHYYLDFRHEIDTKRGLTLCQPPQTPPRGSRCYNHKRLLTTSIAYGVIRFSPPVFQTDVEFDIRWWKSRYASALDILRVKLGFCLVGIPPWRD